MRQRGNWEKENGKENCFSFTYKVRLGSKIEMVVRINSKKSEHKSQSIYYSLADSCVSVF